MRLIQRGNYVPKAQVSCYFCGSILEITRDDVRQDDWAGRNNNYFVRCCVCDNKTLIPEEILRHLYK